MTKVEACELCELAAASKVVANDKFSVILANEANYPGFARVVWNEHVREMSDLPDADRLLLNDAVWKLEQAVREVMQPLKVNVASLGNVVPHLHWHVIPRHADDAHFPAPVWAQAVRETPAEVLEERRALLPELKRAIERKFANR
jgi:diadenosine tetraphosphate (Ap4A) HIT family hydrolase